MIIESGGNFLEQFAPFLFLIILIAIVGLTIWLTVYFFSNRAKKRESEDRRSAMLATPSPGGPAAPAGHLLTLSRTDNGWEIRVNGQVYRDLKDVPDDGVRRQVVAGLRELVSFARSYVQTTKAQSAAPQKTPARPAPTKPAPAKPAPAQPVSSPDPSLAQRLQSVSGPLAPAKSQPQPQPPAEKSEPSTAPQLSSVLGTLKQKTGSRSSATQREPGLRMPTSSPTLVPMIDLAKEIGEILDEMQPQVPSLANRSIRLQNAPGGGLQFAIDGIVYPDIDSIPDPDVQGLIRHATKEWERR